MDSTLNTANDSRKQKSEAMLSVNYFCCYFRLTLLALCSLLFSSTLYASQTESLNIKTITIAPHPYYPYYTDDAGMGIDIYNAAFATQNISINYHYYPVKRAIYKMLNSEVDAFTPGTLFIRDENIRAQLITVPSFIVQIGWLHKQKNDPLQQANFHGKVLATAQPLSKKNQGLQYLTPYIKKGMKTITIDDPKRAIHMVLKDRASYTAIPALSGWHLALKNDIKQLSELEYTQLSPPFVCNLAFSKSNPRAASIASSFQKGMNIIIKNGTYVKILEKYWGKGNIPKAVLFSELKSYGTDKFNKDKIINAYRLMHGNILSPNNPISKL